MESLLETVAGVGVSDRGREEAKPEADQDKVEHGGSLKVRRECKRMRVVSRTREVPRLGI